MAMFFSDRLNFIDSLTTRVSIVIRPEGALTQNTAHSLEKFVTLSKELLYSKSRHLAPLDAMHWYSLA
jgi:hypothetical protein